MNNKQKSNKNFGNKMGKRRLKIRTKEEVVKDIKCLAKKDRGFLNHKKLRQIVYGNLFYAAVKHFGTWNKAILASGETPLQKKWNKEKVTNELKKLYEKTAKVPNFGDLRRNKNFALINAVRRYYGCWANAIKAIGLKPYRNDFWTKDSLIQELKKVVSEFGKVPSKRELKRLGRDDLVSSGTKFFRGYNNFLISSGYKPVLIPNIWTKERIKEEIIKISKKIKRTPTERDLVSLGQRTIIMASVRQFKGWNNAIKFAGLIPNENCVKDKIWKRWELFALEICNFLYPNSKKYKIFPNKSIPDFYNKKDKLVIEIKTNSSDTTIHKDISNYEPYCNRIEIWYLKGKPVNVRSNKVIFRGPKYIKKLLKKDKNKLKEFYNILNKVRKK